MPTIEERINVILAYQPGELFIWNEWQDVMRDALQSIEELRADNRSVREIHERRVAELIEANNRQEQRARDAKARSKNSNDEREKTDERYMNLKQLTSELCGAVLDGTNHQEKYGLHSAVIKATEYARTMRKNIETLAEVRSSRQAETDRANAAEKRASLLEQEMEGVRSASRELERHIDRLREEITSLVTERDRLATGLRNSKDEVGKLHSKVYSLECKLEFKELHAPAKDLEIAKGNVAEMYSKAQAAYHEAKQPKDGHVSVGSGWLRGLMKFLEIVKPLQECYVAQPARLTPWEERDAKRGNHVIYHDTPMTMAWDTARNDMADAMVYALAVKNASEGAQQIGMSLAKYNRNLQAARDSERARILRFCEQNDISMGLLIKALRHENNFYDSFEKPAKTE